MVFDDFMDITIELTEEDLAKLDRLAARADKKIKKLKKKGGAFAQEPGDALPSGVRGSSQQPVQTQEGSQLSKTDKKFERQIDKIEKKIQKNIVKNFGKTNKGIMSKIFGGDKAGTFKTLFSFGKSPGGFMMGIMKGLPILGGILAAKEIAEFIVNEIGKIDRFFKVFIDRVDTRFDQLRSAQLQAEIGAGITQLIVTTQAGNVDARESYNTFDVFNKDRLDLESQFAIRNTSGVD